MANDDSSNEIAQEIEVIVAEDVTPNGIVDDETAESPNDFISEVQEESNNHGNYTPSPLLAAQILAANEEIANDLEERNKKADINLKWLYGIGILVVLGVWEWFVIDIIRSQVYATEQNIFQLSDAVLIALLTSATANILTLPAIILRYLFPRNG